MLHAKANESLKNHHYQWYVSAAITVRSFLRRQDHLFVRNFMPLGTAVDRKTFSMISVEPVKRRVTVRKNQLRKIRGNSYIYSLKNGTSMLRVCQSFFCRTLAISTSVVQTALKKRGACR